MAVLKLGIWPDYLVIFLFQRSAQSAGPICEITDHSILFPWHLYLECSKPFAVKVRGLPWFPGVVLGARVISCTAVGQDQALQAVQAWVVNA